MKIDTLSHAGDILLIWLVVKGDSLSALYEFNFTAIANVPVAYIQMDCLQKNEPEGTESTKLMEQMEIEKK